MSDNSRPNDIVLSKNASASRFEARIGEHLALAEYRISGKSLTFTHTEVPPALRGQGIAKHLVDFALKSAREEGFEIFSECSYVTRLLERKANFGPKS